MKKIPTIFERSGKNRQLVMDVKNPACEWVFNGEGVATRKYDGTCVMIKDGNYYKRREVKCGKEPPVNFRQCNFDVVTGKKIGWVPVNPDLPGDKWHMAAFRGYYPDGTYELIGPKIQKNLENSPEATLVNHNIEATKYRDAPRQFVELKKWLANKDIEGLVFHHPDGRMAKIKKRDFGLPRK